MDQIYCKEGTLCHQYPLEKRKIIKDLIKPFLGMGTITSVIISGLMVVWILGQMGPEEISKFGPNELKSFLALLFILSAALLGSYVLDRLNYRSVFYDIKDNMLIIKSGLFSRKEIIVPLTKVQDVYLDQDIGNRIFKLYDIRFSLNLAGSYLQARIDGLNATNAAALKEKAVEEIRRASSQNKKPAPRDYTGQEILSYRYPREKRVIAKRISGRSETYLIFFGWLAWALMIISPSASKGALNLPIVLFAAFPLVFFGVYLLAKLLREKSSYSSYFYDLTQDKNIIIRQGTTKKQETSVPLSRIQAIYISRDILDRFLKIHSVNFATPESNSGIDGFNLANANAFVSLLIEELNNVSD
ncbi:MAG: PH domain-containing protein [bacterium]|nr:PH domain-containing protein [bacterium]